MSHHQHQHQGHHHHKEQATKFQTENPNYASIDSAPQTFFYTLSNMLKLNQAHDILEVGCGAGKLLSTVLDLKNPKATYHATDMAEGMIKTAKKRLQSHFNKYQSKISFQQWIKQQNLIFEIQNGQKLNYPQNKKFDRIISNMVLCHVDDPSKLLKNWLQFATDDCLLGASMLGNPPVKNNFVKQMKDSIQQAGQKPMHQRPPYYWYDKISKIVEQCGWQIILQWDQNTLFPILSTQSSDLKNAINKGVPEKARPIYAKKCQRMMNVDKCGIQFWGKIIIAKKKSSQK